MLRPIVIALVAAAASTASAQSDDPLPCAGMQRQYGELRGRIGLDRMERLELALRRPCPRLSERIRRDLGQARARLDARARVRREAEERDRLAAQEQARREAEAAQAARPPQPSPQPDRPYYAPPHYAPPPPPSCQPRVVAMSGAQSGRPGPSLFQLGNPYCIDVQYGGVLQVEVNLCDGRPVLLSGIGVERQSFVADGRNRTWGADVFYQLLDPDGYFSPPRQMDTAGSRMRTARFPLLSTRAVRISVPSRPTRGYPIYQRLCSITFSQ